MPKPPLPPGIVLPEIPGPLPATVPRVDKAPANPQTLPDYAKAWAAQPAAEVKVTRDREPKGATPPAQGQWDARLQQTIQETHSGVEALQVLVEPQPKPSRMDTVLELLESIDNRSFRLEERQKSIELMLTAVLRHLRVPIPKG
ncbi:hypothetical protein [Roseicella sp. DB1501]|uniref:hypothetical protein n=1 Tax=Roseicella sp. DB1501 TaxID=2730925 RepID=UPI0020C4B657|nr:hypothetical protein [Roseicella sp. DB1501]